MSHRQNPEQTDWREVECAVLAYLAQHPDAADTLDGIVSWWLPKQRYETERQRIEKALDLMVERGQLRCDRLPGGNVLYALNHADHPSLQ
jgi:hypothetical protein